MSGDRRPSRSDEVCLGRGRGRGAAALGLWAESGRGGCGGFQRPDAGTGHRRSGPTDGLGATRADREDGREAWARRGGPAPFKTKKKRATEIEFSKSDGWIYFGMLLNSD